LSVELGGGAGVVEDEGVLAVETVPHIGGCEPQRGISHAGPECEYSVWIIFSKDPISAFYEVLLFSRTIDGAASFVTEPRLIRIINAAVWPR
jgi:hypothetical protein